MNINIVVFFMARQLKGTCLYVEYKMSEYPTFPQVLLVWMELHGMASREKEVHRV